MEEPTTTKASVLLGDTKRRARRDVSHDCARHATRPSEVCTGITEVYESEDSYLRG